MSKLFIIGNGFDLHHGIPSSYTDFADWLADVDLAVFRAVEEYIPAQIDSAGNALNAWSDLENNLANFDTDQIIEYGNNFLPSYGADDWSDSGHHDHEYEIERITSLVSEKLHVRFVEWLRTLPIPEASAFPPPVRSIDRSGKFLSFNYTPTLQWLYGVRDVLHIHGSLLDEASDIVLGHGWEPGDHESWESQVDEDTDTRVAGGYRLIDDYFRGTFKPTEKIIARNWRFFFSLADIEEIFVFGHSLAAVDRPYFERILRGVPQTANWTISYYGASERWEKAELAEAMGIPVARTSFTTLDRL